MRTYRRCLLCAVWTLGQEHRQRSRKVRSASDHRKEGDDDVSCVPYGPWDKSTGRDLEGGVVCESPMSPVCRPRIA